ncbi:MAG: guanylate kinase [Granulosicoccaceae bacterium]
MQLFVVSAPSGAGKTSLVRRTVKELAQLSVSVSHTTRGIRTGEVDGEDYHFVDRDAFEQMISAGQFLEYANVFGHYYGTSIDVVKAMLGIGIDVILEIDWQGAEQVRKTLPDAVAIFILPPSREALIERLTSRGQDSEEVIERRTLEAVDEMRQHHHADFLIINDNFDEALSELKAIIVSQRLDQARQGRLHAELIESLISLKP